MIDKSEFLNEVASNYLNKIENMFISKFSFEGDDAFDISAQRLFFRTIFREGQAAVVDILTSDKRSIQRYYPHLDKKLGIGNNGIIESAYIYPAWLNFTGNSYGSFANYIKNTDGKGEKGIGLEVRNIKDNNIVFYQNHQGEDIYSGKSLGQRLAVHIKDLALRHYQSSIYNTIAGGKIATTSTARINEQIEYNLYNPGQTIKLDTNYDNENDSRGDLSEEVNQNVNIIKFDLDPNKFLDTIIGYEAIVYKLFGIRINQRFKKERVINAEVANDDHEFNAADYNLKQSFEKFIIDYEKKFNKKLVLIDNLAEEEEEPTDETIAPNGENDKIESGGNTNE